MPALSCVVYFSHPQANAQRQVVSRDHRDDGGHHHHPGMDYLQALPVPVQELVQIVVCRDGVEVLTSKSTRPLSPLQLGEKMSRLLLTNIAPDTSDEEIRTFLEKYGFPPFDSLEHEDGDGTHPAVLLTYETLDPAVLGKLQQRIDHMYWKKRQLSASILHDRFA
ncbi:hypothetical protein [Cupriavidus alkaliphilus]|nr:hypothetical protein [Cupriavidus alkaliphilus]